MNQIVCVSTSPWKPLPMSKQQIMSRLPDCEIIYFDPPVTFIAPLKDKSAKAKLKLYKQPGDKINDHITTYTMPPVLPFFNKCRLINKLNQRRLARYVKKVMKAHGFTKPIIWAYSHTCCDLVKHIPHKAVVYHCVDRHSAFKGLIDPELVDNMEYDLCRQADAVFCTAEGLKARLLPYNPQTVYIPNGANFELFSQAASGDLTCPKDMEDIKGPVLGFVGALQECNEYGYILEAAKAKPQWSFVFIGSKLPGVDLSQLEQQPNVHFLGTKPHEELPAYISRFDVCLNLFKTDELTKDVSPLKFYEYLATGKPIVSTPEPQQIMQYADLIHIASSSEDFIQKCEEAIAEKDESLTEKRLAAGKSCSWDSRVSEFVSILKKLYLLQ